MRAIPLLLAALVTMAAAPVDTSALPVPPTPPTDPPQDVAAPTPDADAHGPITAASTDPWVAVENFKADRYDPSLGFAPGSRFETAEDRKPIQTPGISIRVPLK
jgi:hypothetical protein